jgi:hypothetical protein
MLRRASGQPQLAAQIVEEGCVAEIAPQPSRVEVGESEEGSELGTWVTKWTRDMGDTLWVRAWRTARALESE